MEKEVLTKQHDDLQTYDNTASVNTTSKGSDTNLTTDMQNSIEENEVKQSNRKSVVLSDCLAALTPDAPLVLTEEEVAQKISDSFGGLVTVDQILSNETQKASIAKLVSESRSAREYYIIENIPQDLRETILGFKSAGVLTRLNNAFGCNFEELQKELRIVRPTATGVQNGELGIAYLLIFSDKQNDENTLSTWTTINNSRFTDNSCVTLYYKEVEETAENVALCLKKSIHLINAKTKISACYAEDNAIFNKFKRLTTRMNSLGDLEEVMRLISHRIEDIKTNESK